MGPDVYRTKDTKSDVEQDGDYDGSGPVTSTWTTVFLTREGEGRKTMGDLFKGQNDLMEGVETRRFLQIRISSDKMGQASRWDMGTV